MSTVTLPAETYGVAGRYASALWLAAAKSNNLEIVEKDLDQVAKSIVPGGIFERFLHDPTFSKKEKGAAMAAALTGSSEQTKSLFGQSPIPQVPPLRRRPGLTLCACRGLGGRR
jgi:hypothetical protein